MAVALKIGSGRLLSLDSENDVNEWDALVDSSPYADTYYRTGYVGAYQEPNLAIRGLVLETKSRRYLLPLVLRPIANLSFATSSRDLDAFTPYGYGGILPLDEGPVSTEEGLKLAENLQEWCKKNNVISCFVRLHSLDAQENWFHGLDIEGIHVGSSGPTKSVELELWDEKNALPASLVATRSEKIRYRKKLAVEVHTCDQAESTRALSQFIEIYTETMKRLQATNFYFFPESYFLKLAAGLGRDMAVVIARRDGVAVGGSVFFADVRYAHYHLSGSTDLGRRLHATAVVILKGAEWARSRGCRRLHLGGGLTPDDSLFKFKETFGGKTFQFCSLRVIGDRDCYQGLVAGRKQSTLGPIRPNFFPEYRG